MSLEIPQFLQTTIDSQSSPTLTDNNIAREHLGRSGIFSIQNAKASLEAFGKKIQIEYPIAVAKRSNINIFSDFVWCNTNFDRSEIPWVNVEEREITFGQTVTNLQRAIDIASGISQGKIDPYLTLYTAKPTGFYYTFPNLLGDKSNLRTISNNWQAEKEKSYSDVKRNKDLGEPITQSFADTIRKATGIVEKGAELLSGLGTGILAGVGTEEPFVYTGTNLQKFTLSFPLYNTRDLKSAFENYSFCMLFAFQNLKTRTSFSTYIPPKIYKIESLNGGIDIPVAYVSDFTVESIGTTRVLYDFQIDGFTNSPIIVPEAYKVTITFSEIIPQSSNILLGVMGGKKVSVIQSQGSSLAEGFNALNTVTNFFNVPN